MRWRPTCGSTPRSIDGNTAQALETGEADLALGYIPWLESGIYQQTLYPQDWVCLLTAPSAHRQDADAGRVRNEAHIGIVGGTGAQVLETALHARRVRRRIALELPGFLGLYAIVSTTDLIATLPRHTGETLAKLGRLKVFPCPVPIPIFTVKQHWHARYHHDAGNRWLRGTIASLFLQHSPRGADTGARARAQRTYSR